jgi:hypothetical protein
MELAAAIAALSFLPLGMIVPVSSDSQYVRESVLEWLRKWKQNGWKNSKKQGVSNATLWRSLDSDFARHQRVEFASVNGHSGILLNECADQLATRAIQGSSSCPTPNFDVLPDQPESDVELVIGDNEVTRREDWDDPDHSPSFSHRAISVGLEADEELDGQAVLFQRLSRDGLGNSSAEVPSADEYDGQQLPDPEESNAIVVTPGSSIMDFTEPVPWGLMPTFADQRAQQERERLANIFSEWMSRADKHVTQIEAFSNAVRGSNETTTGPACHSTLHF